MNYEIKCEREGFVRRVVNERRVKVMSRVRIGRGEEE